METFSDESSLWRRFLTPVTSSSETLTLSSRPETNLTHQRNPSCASFSSGFIKHDEFRSRMIKSAVLQSCCRPVRSAETTDRFLDAVGESTRRSSSSAAHLSLVAERQRRDHLNSEQRVNIPLVSGGHEKLIASLHSFIQSLQSALSLPATSSFKVSLSKKLNV